MIQRICQANLDQVGNSSELTNIRTLFSPSVETGKYQGIIGVGGLVLARISEELAVSRESYFNQQTNDRDEALSNDVLKDQHPSMPIDQERQTRVTFGGSKK